MIKDNDTYKWIKTKDTKSNFPFVKAKLISVKEKTLKVQIDENIEHTEVNK